ncbi:hypothetical protein HPU229334_00470 [Helicobacter pullorum]|uniref:Uncharacterized protein n=1 Tax=Helicobacter pullorum TaxID=35818 RepID=A0A0N1EGT1_9HELI|nr:hypothetical protein [Helicobacter pullorum]KAB0574535.1 hypothetical protein F7P74_06265 [Helicobacter pullorum NCTC 12824]KPH54720.1 hypothetical protein HPU229334_00470 [Helicobacter pullorum]
MKLIILPQKTQYDEKIFLFDENMAVCENGKILYYDNLGHLHGTNYECILDSITENTPAEEIKKKIINLENILIDFFIVNLIENTINNERFDLIDEDTISYKGFLINLETLEIRGSAIELKSKDEIEAYFEANKMLYSPEGEVQKSIKAIIQAVYRQNIDNFVDYEFLRNFLEERL